MGVSSTVVIIILGGKGTVKHLCRWAQTVTAALTVAMGIVSELPSWVRRLWCTMSHASSGVEMAAGDILVVVG